MDYESEIKQQVEDHLAIAKNEYIELEQMQAALPEKLEKAEQDIKEIMKFMRSIGMDPPVFRTDILSEEQVRDWVRDRGQWTKFDMCNELDMSLATADFWINNFRARGMIEGDSNYVFTFVKPGGTQPKRHRGSEPPNKLPDGLQNVSVPQPARGMPVQGTGNHRYPEHVQKVIAHLKEHVLIEKKGNGHLFFISKRDPKMFTWTSHSPKNPDDEYDQLVRRLKTKNMWED